MSEGTIPEWDLCDRMRKSLRHADLQLQQMAEYLGVSPNSVSNWVTGKNRPSMPVLRLWAMRTGVPLEWLRSGAAGVRTPGFCPAPVLAVAA